ncbi:DUF5615 family PIN-like protein [Candidatus Poriferisocius sp.]|uniref:DUF5615 family PIN-like protein n=1 Tax=Candidatus Poriferisocius sp. TaxID=3101276 RepID=UPI003B0114FD
MRFLIDANLSPQVAQALRVAGHEAQHVSQLDMLTASDETILKWAAEHDSTLITADSDFGALLSIRRANSPSVVHLRGVADQPSDVHTALLIENLPAIEEALVKGSIVSLSPTRIRIRDLPIT